LESGMNDDYITHYAEVPAAPATVAIHLAAAQECGRVALDVGRGTWDRAGFARLALEHLQKAEDLARRELVERMEASA
jgi:hypothetical protein